MNLNSLVKLSLSLLVLIVNNYELTAQRNQYLSFSIGASMPKARLAQADSRDSSTGYGLFGLAYNFKYESQLKKGWGAYVNIQNASIRFDAENYVLDVENALGTDWNWSEYTSRPYNIKSLNSGFSYTFNEGQKFKLTGYLGTGLSLCRNRELDETFVSRFGTIRATATAEHAIVSNINFGLKACYVIKDKYELFADIAYQTQSPKFVNHYNYYIDGNFYKESKDTFVQPMYFNTTTLGIRYTFLTIPSKEKP